MKDTTPEIESLFYEMLMKKTGEERMKMGFSMFEMARRQVISSIKSEKPHLDEKEIRKEIFLRFYGQDFSQEDREKILAKI